jgi:chromosomal replication initiation ATPase DnaA
VPRAPEFPEFLQQISHFAKCGVQDGLRSPRRGSPRVVLARQIAMYLAHVTLSERLGTVGAHFGRDRSTVGHACARIEEERDDPALDETLAALEGALRYWRRAPLEERA